MPSERPCQALRHRSRKFRGILLSMFTTPRISLDLEHYKNASKEMDVRN